MKRDLSLQIPAWVASVLPQSLMRRAGNASGETSPMTRNTAGQQAYDPGFPVHPKRFNQKYVMFLRAMWDEASLHDGKRFYVDPTLAENHLGWRHVDRAAQAAAWNLEDQFAQGNQRGNSGLYSWEGISKKAERLLAANGKVENAPDEMSRMVKAVARHLGASMVGICQVHPNWVYSREFDRNSGEGHPLELPEGCDNAVVMAIEMDYETIRSSSRVLQNVAAGLGYSKMAFLASQVAAFIRGLGYRALPSGNDTAINIPLAMAAGLGECSRMGLLVTPKFGPRIRLCKVFTDLPLAVDSYRPFGVEAFCKICKTCAKYCPAQGIAYGDMTVEGPTVSSHSGLRKWYINAEKCFSFWATRQISCIQCIRVCPFNKPAGRIHDFSRFLIKRTSLFNRFLVWVDKRMGYLKPFHPDRFWNHR
jgi:reductive dehalogenase